MAPGRHPRPIKIPPRPVCPSIPRPAWARGVNANLQQIPSPLFTAIVFREIDRVGGRYYALNEIQGISGEIQQCSVENIYPFHIIRAVNVLSGGMNITDFLIMDGNGVEIEADASGDSLAFCCEDCGYPLLAIARENARGSSEQCPSSCRDCGAGYFLDVRNHAQKIYVHRTNAH